jgi:Lrp/AsnC family transcriptional regulator of ectoine degradation
MHARSQKMKLDPIDLKIVAALKRDGRMTKLRLAEVDGLQAWRPASAGDSMR